MPLDVGDITRQLQAVYLDSTPPKVSRADMAGLIQEQRKVMGIAEGALGQLKRTPQAWPQWMTTEIMAQTQSDIDKQNGLLDYFDSQLFDADTDEEIYKTVVSPLVGGTCYAPPVCSQALLDSQNGRVFMAPLAVMPYRIINTISKQSELATEEWVRFKADVAERVQAGGDLMKGAVVLAVAWFLLKDD